MKNGKKDETKSYKMHHNGIDYKERINYFSRASLHWAMYNGDQYRGISVKNLPKIVINICKQDVNYKIAAIMSQDISIRYRPMGVAMPETYDDPKEKESAMMKKAYCDMLTSIVKKKWETQKMSKKLRTALLDAAITGDMAFFTFWNADVETGQYEKGDMETIVVDGANVFFDDANTNEAEKQPRIMLTGRDSVKNLRNEAKKHGMKQEDIDKITSDDDVEYQIGEYGKIEVDNDNNEGKATYFVMLWKENGTVMYQKETRYTSICNPTNTRLKKYNLNYGNWETVKNSMHGMDEIRGIVPNQLAVNQLNSLIVLWMRNNAFGKVAYDETRVSSYSNSVDNSIAIKGDIAGAVVQLQPGQFNQAIVGYSNNLLENTKNALGVSEAALGQINPENTSAIAVTVKQASIPLENIKANVYQLVEDWAYTQADFVKANYKNRTVMVEIDGEEVPVKYEMPDDIMLDVAIDVGPSSYYSEIAGIATLDNLMVQNRISMKQYYERIKKFDIIPDVDGLIKNEEEKEIMAKQAQMMVQQQPMQPKMQPPMI